MDGVMTSGPSQAAAPARETPSVVTFPEGIIGFPAAKRFRFESSEEIAPLVRLRCIDGPGVAFLHVDPGLVLPDYRPGFPPEALAAMGIVDGQPPLVLTIARISPRIEECTANLMAPLLINPATMRGLQVILESGPWSPRHPLVPASPPAE